MRYFVALYEEHSITKAARRLHVVQPAVSMQIRRLEANYDTVLFERTQHGVMPNEAARRLYPICTDILDRLEQADNMLRAGSGQPCGTLSAGIPPSMSNGVMAHFLFEFRDRNPNVKLLISEGYTHRLLEWLLEGEIDVAVVSQVGYEKRLCYEPLATEDYMLITSVETPLSGDSLACVKLNELNLIVPSAQNQLRLLLDKALASLGVVLTPSMEIDSLPTVLAMVRKPGWASILPASAGHKIGTESGMRSLRLVDPVIQRTLVAALPVQKPKSVGCQRFIEGLRAALNERPVPALADNPP